jgi:hypothetical protein
MSVTVPSESLGSDPPSPSLLTRAVRVFVDPARAWDGLREHVQWWFPMLIVMVLACVSAAVLYDRAIVPMQLDAVERQVQDGQIPADRLEAIEAQMTHPVVKWIGIGMQGVTYLIISLVTALVVWFGLGFVMGTRFSYRLALELVCWSSLVRIPEMIVVGVLAWTKESFQGVHAGFGVLLPETEVPTRLGVGLGIVLDALGPLGIWYIVVGVIGAAALTGLPRKSVALTLCGLYLGVIVFFAAVAALLTPGS